MSAKKFKNQKALAVASYLLSLQGNKSDKYWMAKVMYYVERESLIKNGQPLFYDDLFSLPYGPIVSSVNDNIDLCSYPVETEWNEHFNLIGNDVTLEKEADYSILSAFEKRIIKEAQEKFFGWGFDKLHKFFESLPEYKKTKGRIPISYIDILSSEGLKKEVIEETLGELNYINQLESSLHCA